jgi:putative MATE family efflux protein
MVLEMTMESLFAVVDMFWVGKLGADAVAAVVLTESLLTLVYCIATGIAMAATAYVARRIGEKDREGASIGAVQTIAVSFVLSVAIGIPAALTAPHLLELMGASDAVVKIGTGHASVILGGSGSAMLLIVVNAIFRGAGDATIAMRALWLGNILNMILNPCLIFGWGPFPEMGVTGSGTGTTIGRSVAVIYLFWVLLHGKGRIGVARRHLQLVRDAMVRIVRTSMTGTLQWLIAGASWTVLVRTVALFGDKPVAGYGIAIRIIIFSILPAWGMCNAAATLVGQNLGAGQPERAERSVWMTGLYNMFFLGGIGVLFIIFAGPLIRIFTSDASVIPYGVDCLRFISYGYLAYAYGMVLVQAFNGAGDTLTPTLINFGCYWLVQIPLARLLALNAGMGPRGVFLAVTVAETLLAVVAIVVFRRGKWKLQKI